MLKRLVFLLFGSVLWACGETATMEPEAATIAVQLTCTPCPTCTSQDSAWLCGSAEEASDKADYEEEVDGLARCYHSGTLVWCDYQNLEPE